jgi:hypothetical protein
MMARRTRRPYAPPLHMQLDAQRAEYQRILTAWADETHRRLYHDPRRLYAYLVPSTATAYGQIVTVADGETPPAGAVLMDPEPISGFKTRPQLGAWIKALADWRPMYPNLKG